MTFSDYATVSGVDLLPPEARLLAIAHASADRDLLARLRRSQTVVRDPGVGRHVDGAAAFGRDIEARAFGTRNLAIRPKRRRR